MNVHYLIVYSDCSIKLNLHILNKIIKMNSNFLIQLLNLMIKNIKFFFLLQSHLSDY